MAQAIYVVIANTSLIKVANAKQSTNALQRFKRVLSTRAA
jgi:hypothetical protein